MNEPNPIDRAIAQCDRLLDNIDSIQRDMRDACEKMDAELQRAIAMLKEPRRA